MESKDLNKLLPIREDNGKKAVSAQCLYNFLGYNKSQWRRWYRTNIENNEYAVENVDYQTFDIVSNGNETKDFALTLSFAKELCMLARNEKGKEARLYFIDCEKAANESNKAMTLAEQLLAQAKLNIEQERRLKSLENRMDAFDEERKVNTEALLSLPLSDNIPPELKMKDRIRELVNAYSNSIGVTQQDVWHKVYQQLYYIHHISVNSYKKLTPKESKLSVAERNGFLDKIFDIISNLIREGKQK